MSIIILKTRQDEKKNNGEKYITNIQRRIIFKSFNIFNEAAKITPTFLQYKFCKKSSFE